MIDGAERVLAIPPHIASFALPFGVSLARVNTAPRGLRPRYFWANSMACRSTFAQLALLGADVDSDELQRAGNSERRTVHHRAGVHDDRNSGRGHRHSHRARRDSRTSSRRPSTSPAQMTTAVLLARFEPATERASGAGGGDGMRRRARSRACSRRRARARLGAQPPIAFTHVTVIDGRSPIAARRSDGRRHAARASRRPGRARRSTSRPARASWTRPGSS